jgi:predicted MFS family arabinose efflux permease
MGVRLLRRLTGQARVPRDARLVILAAMAQSIATSGFSTYVGIWAIEGLHASAAALGVALLLRAGSGVLTGPIGGRWSDTRGRRPVIVSSWLAQAACIGAFTVVGRNVAIGLALIVLFGPLGPPGRAAAAAYIADVTSPGERPVAYSALRSAQALAQITGPAVAAVLAGGSRWPVMFGTLAVVSLAAACGAALLPRRDSGRPGKTAAPAARTGSPWRDHPYVAFLIAATVITLTMAATDRFLPIAAVGTYHVPTRAWGLIALLNPVLVVALQTTLTRRTESVRASARIAAAAALTGLPFLLLLPFSGVGVVVTVVVIATFGEMLWLPLAQALASDLAPPDRVGAYLGAFDGATSLAYATGPTLALEVRAAAGSATVWAMFAGLAAVGAVIAIRACRALAARVTGYPPVPRAAPQPAEPAGRGGTPG